MNGKSIVSVVRVPQHVMMNHLLSISTCSTMRKSGTGVLDVDGFSITVSKFRISSGHFLKKIKQTNEKTCKCFREIYLIKQDNILKVRQLGVVNIRALKAT